MNQSEVDLVLRLARSETVEERRQHLRAFAVGGNGTRMPAEARAAFRRLAQEEAPVALRPRPDASRRCDALVRVDPGPDPVLSNAAARDLDEWCTGWERAAELVAAGCEPPGPLLLHGPPGTGKTATTRAIARRLDAVGRSAYVLDAHRFVGSHLGESGSNAAKAFAAAEGVGAVLVLEELDAVGTARGGGSIVANEETRITVALMRMVESTRIPLVFTTNRVGALDPALRRRCEYELDLPEPTPEQKRTIVAEVLGDDPGPIAESRNLTHLVPLARRARRIALLEGVAPAVVWARLKVAA